MAYYYPSDYNFNLGRLAPPNHYLETKLLPSIHLPAVDLPKPDLLAMQFHLQQRPHPYMPLQHFGYHLTPSQPYLPYVMKAVPGYQMPLSPASIESDSNPQLQAHSGSAPMGTGYGVAPMGASGTERLSVDYSSLISYTVSPLKRRRRACDGVSTTAERTFLCPQCPKVFQKPYNLKSHMKSHSDDKPFDCLFCDRKFARLHDKKRHEALHGGRKNFRCEGYLKDGTTSWGCGKKFARSDALLRHFRTETGWLCIKPLMDEAKYSENRAANATLQQHGLFNHYQLDSKVRYQ